jgi:hypothetical protein
MKLLSTLIVFLSLSFVTVLAVADADSDGVSDETDVCPRVYSRSRNGCPALAEPKKATKVTPACYQEQLKRGLWVASISDLCTGDSCLKISGARGVQACDIVFPVIFDRSGVPIIRGSVYVVK